MMLLEAPPHFSAAPSHRREASTAEWEYLLLAL